MQKTRNRSEGVPVMGARKLTPKSRFCPITGVNWPKPWQNQFDLDSTRWDLSTKCSTIENGRLIAKLQIFKNLPLFVPNNHLVCMFVRNVVLSKDHQTSGACSTSQTEQLLFYHFLKFALLVTWKRGQRSKKGVRTKFYPEPTFYHGGVTGVSFERYWAQLPNGIPRNPK